MIKCAGITTVGRRDSFPICRLVRGSAHQLQSQWTAVELHPPAIGTGSRKHTSKGVGWGASSVISDISREAR